MVATTDAAAALLHPLKSRILALAREPASASELARRLELPRQRVHYYVRELELAGLLRPAGRRRRRNFIEQRFSATARSYVLSPSLLGPLAADWRAVADTGSPDYLLALVEQVRRDVARAAEEAVTDGQRPAILTLKAQFRFESEAQRLAFGAAIRDAIVGAIARHTSPDRREGGRGAAGQLQRLVLASYPVASGGPPVKERRP